MNPIEMLNMLGMVRKDDLNYSPQNSWEKSLEALKANPSPKAQELYNKLYRKYSRQLSTDNGRE